MIGITNSTVTLVGIALAVMCALLIIGIVFDQIRLARHRGMPRQAFIEEFTRIQVPSEIPSVVYDYYKLVRTFGKFAPTPDDSYENTFRMVHEDIDDDAENLVAKLGLEMPIEPILREWPNEIKTIRDMVLWLEWIRQHQPKHSA